MDTETLRTPKKKLPGWVKILIGLAIFGATMSVIASIGIGLLAHYVKSKGTDALIHKGIEMWVEKAVKESGGKPVDVKIDKEGMVVRDKQTGKPEFEAKREGKLPENFPPDIPIYSPALISGSMTFGPMTFVTLESPSPIEDIFSFYQTKLTAMGWTSSNAILPGTGDRSATYKKGDRQMSVNLSRGKDKTAISLSYGLGE